MTWHKLADIAVGTAIQAGSDSNTIKQKVNELFALPGVSSLILFVQVGLAVLLLYLLFEPIIKALTKRDFKKIILTVGSAVFGLWLDFSIKFAINLVLDVVALFTTSTN